MAVALAAVTAVEAVEDARYLTDYYAEIMSDLARNSIETRHERDPYDSNFRFLDGTGQLFNPAQSHRI